MIETVKVLKRANQIIQERHGSHLEIRSRQIQAAVQAIVEAVNESKKRKPRKAVKK